MYMYFLKRYIYILYGENLETKPCIFCIFIHIIHVHIEVSGTGRRSILRYLYFANKLSKQVMDTELLT